MTDILVWLERYHHHIFKLLLCNNLLHLSLVRTFTHKYKVNIRMGLLYFRHHIQQHIHILSQSDVARVLKIELRAIQIVLIEQLVLVTRNIYHSILIYPIIDHHNLVLRYPLSYNIVLEILRDNDNFVCMPVCEVLNHTTDFPK